MESIWNPHGIQVGHILPDILQNLPGIHMESMWIPGAIYVTHCVSIKGYFI